MTWTNLGHKLSSGANGVTTTGFDSRGTGGRKKVAVVGISWYTPTATPPTFTDSNGNVWKKAITNPLAGSFVSAQAWYCLNPTLSVSHTVTTVGTAVYNAVVFAVFETDETLSVALDGAPTSNAESNANVNVKPGAITPSRANTLLWAFAGHAGQTSQALSVLTMLDSIDVSGGVNEGAAHGWINAAASSQDPQFSWTTNVVNDHNAIMIAIKAHQTLSWAVDDLNSGEVVPLDIT